MGSFDGESPTLIRTKLHRPRLDRDLIIRPKLIDRLNQGSNRKLTLISAQAGAGKTTLLAQWLANSPLPSAWLSLDENDNDLMAFLSYLCAAIQTIFPDSCEYALDLLNAPTAPPTRVITTTLVNELVALCDSRRSSGEDKSGMNGLVIALDDYHLIKDSSIHAVVSELLAYLPQCVNLALSSRNDPPLPLAGLRARGEMTELRTSDLRLTAEEAGALLELTLGRKPGNDTIDLLTERTEGWLVGLRLAALSMRDLPDDRDFTQRLEGTGSSFVADYLISEVLSQQSPAHQEFLLRSSILDRFNAELCDALIESEDDILPAIAQPGTVSSAAILRGLKSANLFLIRLDQEGKWYRYQHLFRDLLRHRLHSQHDPEQIRTLHSRASRWFEKNGLIEEALAHAFSSGQVDRAAAIVSRQRYDLLNQARWQQLDSYLRRFPAEYVSAQPDMAMLKTWLIYHQGHYDQLPAALAQVEAAMTKRELTSEKARHLKGEINTVRSLVSISRANVEQTIAEAQFSLRNTPPELWIVRSLARVTLAAAYQAQGELGRAYEIVYGGIGDETHQSDRLKATTFLTACNIHWMAADMPGLIAVARKCVELCDQPHAGQIMRGARYHLGCVHYLQNDLDAAEDQFSRVVQRPYLNYGDFFAYSAFGLSLVHQARNRPQDAKQVAEMALAHILETGNMTLLPVANAFQAELALMQGELSAASHWAEQFNSPPPMGLMFRFYEPRLTLVRIRLAEATRSSRQQAAEYLEQLQDFAEITNNKIVLIAVLAMSAMVHAAEDDEPAALGALSKAVELAEPGRLTRLFVDQGSSMAQLLQALYEQSEIRGNLRQYLAQILAAFPKAVSDQSQSDAGTGLEPGLDMVTSLTTREMEVLELLEQRLTNKEIADELVISPDTVKSHTVNIYGKLDVHGRREAVDKAKQIGLL
jgi:LuxR family maltose regulon positive regulatory protein